MKSQMSSQYQTTVPAEVRESLKIKPGNKLNWSIAKDSSGLDYIVVIPQTKNNISALKGVAKGLYKDKKNYLDKERLSWN